jgi:putative PEP-CTERM system TPR-repeat lipoprotein
MNAIFKIFMAACVTCIPIACGSNLTDTQYVDSARTYLDQGELRSASIELKNALLQNPDNAEARILLGQVQIELGNAETAEKELRRASSLGVADGAVLPLLARALLAQREYDKLEALPLYNLPDAETASILAAQVLGKLAQADMEAAAERLDQALSLDPQSAYVRVAGAQLLAAKREFSLARQELNAVLQTDPGDAMAWDLLGVLETEEGHLQQAEAAYTQAIENSENNFTYMLKRAMVRIQQKKYAEAQQDIDVLRKQAPRNPGVTFTQGVLYLSTNRLDEASEAFELTLRANPRHLMAKYYLGLTHQRLGNRQQAEDYARQFHSAVPRSIPGRKLMATIELENRQYAAAEALMRPVVVNREDDVVAANLLAQALLKQGKTDEAIVLLEKAVTLWPDSAAAQYRLGAGLLAAKQYEAGVERLQKALDMDPRLLQADVLLIQYQLEQEDFQQALAAAEAYRKRHPDSAAPYNMIGRVQLAAGQEKEAAEAFARARDMAPGDRQASHALAALAVRQKAYQEARGYYQDVLEHRQNDLSTLLKLAVLDALENKEALMLEHLQQATRAHPQSVQPKLLLARYHLDKGEAAKVPPLMLELSDRQQQAAPVLEVMAFAHLAQKQYPEARYGLEQLVKKRPDSAEAHYLLGRAYAGVGDRAGLKRELERTIELEPKHLAARVALARLLLLEGEKDGVTEQLAVIDELSPDHPEVLRLKASLARAQGEQERTSALLDDVFEASPSTTSMLSVARQRWAMGDQAAALELQEQWVEGNPDDMKATLALASTYSQQDRVEPAIAQYQRVLEKDEQNVTALNGLAWHLRESQPAKALRYAERAAELAPDSVLVMDTLAVVLLNNGQVEHAKRTIERVYQKEPNAPTVRYHRAMIDAAAGEKAAAIRALQALLNDGGNFSEKAEAQQLLAELQAGG